MTICGVLLCPANAPRRGRMCKHTRPHILQQLAPTRRNFEKFAAVDGDFRQMVFPAVLEVSADTNTGILSRFGARLEELAIKMSEEGKEEGKCCTRCCKGRRSVWKPQPPPTFVRQLVRKSKIQKYYPEFKCIDFEGNA